MKIKFLGTGASEGIPDLFCRCAVCEKARKEGKWTYYSLVRERIQELKNILG